VCAAEKRRRPAPDSKAIAGNIAAVRSAIRTIRILVQAFNEAASVGLPVTEFAVELRACEMEGASTADLRWLVSRNCAEHLIELRSRGNRRKFRASPGLAFEQRSCFVVTALGLRFARKHAARQQARADVPPATAQQIPPETPRWDAHARELRFRGVLVKRCERAAPNQTEILDHFQLENWPRRIADPLPFGAADPKRRMRETIADLNEHQQHSLIRFRADGTGEGIVWEPVDPPRPGA